ncbi:MAG: hypothetical protein Kow00108_08900 [Calditrichia bacterium]
MKKILFIFTLVTMMGNFAIAQEVQQDQQPQLEQTQLGEGAGVIDLTQEAIRIERRIEMPRVSIFDKRVEPQFDDITMDRSFMNEIVGKTEEVGLLSSKTILVKPIKDVDKILKKNR